MTPAARKGAIIAAAGVAAFAGVCAIVLGPAAPWLVDNLADGQKAWRLGRLQVDGVSGGALSGLRAQRITLSDEQGVWAEAEDVALDWRPLALFLGDVRLDSAAIARLHILRQPVLSAPEKPGGISFDIYLSKLDVPHITLDEPVAGVAALLKLGLDLEVENDKLEQLNLALERLDNDADSALVRFSDQDGQLHLNGDVTGAPGGVFAHFLGVENETVLLHAEGAGDTHSGNVVATGRIGDAPLLDARLGWREAAWTLSAHAEPGAAPFFSDIVARIGDTIDIDAGGEREGAFRAEGRAPNASIVLAGEKTRGWSLDGPAQLTLETPDLARLVPETNIGGAGARFTGTISKPRDETTIAGTLSAQNISPAGQRIDLEGPARVRLTQTHVRVDADLKVGDGAAELYRGAALTLDFDYDRQRSRAGLTRARLDGPSLLVTAQGWFANGDGEFSGEWRIKRMQAASEMVEGSAAGRWRARGDPRQGWIAALDGRGENMRSTQDAYASLMGPSPTIDAAASMKDGVITIDHARLQGSQLRAAVTGAIRNQQASLRLEASARGPIKAGAATIEGGADATGSLTGDISRPRIEAHAALASMQIAGIAVDHPTLSLTLAPNGNAYRGTVLAEGQVSGQASRVQSDIQLDDNGVAFPALVADVAAMHAEGSARFSNAGPSANLIVGGRIDSFVPGASGQIKGDVALTPDNITVDASLSNAAIGMLRMTNATVQAAGPYDNINAQFGIHGALNRASLSFDGTANIASRRSETIVRLEGQGALAGAAMRLNDPTIARIRDGATDVRVNATIDDGRLDLAYTSNNRRVTIGANMNGAPVAPIIAIWGERGTGRMSGTAQFAGNGHLTGEMDITLDNARFVSRSNETINGRFQLDLMRDRITANVDARSSDGLTAQFEADAPIENSTRPLRIAIAPQRYGRASWSVHGPVGGLFTAARLNDQRLTGDVNGEGSLRFGAGSLTGQGDIAITNGDFEDKLSGVKLRAIDASVHFSENGAQIERFTATDGGDGRITATGGAANPQHGSIAIRLENIHLVDRPDARARASGQLELSWQGVNAKLAGRIRLLEGDVSIAGNYAAAVPQLEVIEINRPNVPDEPILPTIGVSQNNATQLDIAIVAPGRIFTRGRGVNAEWSLDMRLDGTVAAPRIYGAAEIIRGDISLSGRPFDIQEGRITFTGDPMESQLHIVAERETNDLTAIMRLTGTAQDPDISFTSQPGLPEDEILPQILFGRNVEDLNALEAAQLASSIAQLSGQASFSIADTARRIAGLDRFDVRQDDSGGLLVAGGVYLTRDVYLEVARNGLGQAETTAEWRLRRQLLLITSFLPNSDQRVSLRWRREHD
ncbi:MAG: translocation/assembly module TamB domain-containing protein [Caulobacterales bacterium]